MFIFQYPAVNDNNSNKQGKKFLGLDHQQPPTPIYSRVPNCIWGGGGGGSFSNFQNSNQYKMNFVKVWSLEFGVSFLLSLLLFYQDHKRFLDFLSPLPYSLSRK